MNYMPSEIIEANQVCAEDMLHVEHQGGRQWWTVLGWYRTPPALAREGTVHLHVLPPSDAGFATDPLPVTLSLGARESVEVRRRR